MKVPPPMPERFPARIRVPLTNNLMAISGTTIEGKRLGLVIASSAGPVVAPTDARGFSASTVVHKADVGLNFGTINLAVPQVDGPCQPGEVCVTVTVRATTGPDLKLMLYETAAGDWPQKYRSLPTPSWVVTKTVPVPTNSTSVRIHIPLATNLFAFSSRTSRGRGWGWPLSPGWPQRSSSIPPTPAVFRQVHWSIKRTRSWITGPLRLTSPKVIPVT